MNLTNLKRMFNYILLNVPEEKINMSQFRDSIDLKSHECKSIGCIIGHCTILDKYENIPKKNNGELDFLKWSEKFTDLEFNSNEWEWCFGSSWQKYYKTATKEQILLRLRFIIKNKRVPVKFKPKGRFLYYLESIFIFKSKNKLTPYIL